MATPNGYSNIEAMQPRAIKKCPYCDFPLTSVESKCSRCAQPAKGIPVDVQPRPEELPAPRPELEGGR